MTTPTPVYIDRVAADIARLLTLTNPIAATFTILQAAGMDAGVVTVARPRQNKPVQTHTPGAVPPLPAVRATITIEFLARDRVKGDGHSAASPDVIEEILVYDVIIESADHGLACELEAAVVTDLDHADGDTEAGGASTYFEDGTDGDTLPLGGGQDRQLFQRVVRIRALLA